MCGIGGIINLSKKKSKYSFLNINYLRKSLKKRGPDANGNWISEDKNIVITVQRLATQDKREIANQPCFNNNKNIIVIMNGEILNHTELRNFLKKKNYFFETFNDTEVVANAYDYWGENFLNKLEGQFAIFAYNKKEKKGIIARDKHGIAPIYYSNQKNKIIFSSTPESIFFNEKMKLEINKKAYNDFIISGCVTSNNTFFKNIKYLSPGSFICFDLFKKKSKIKFFNEKLKINKVSKKNYLDIVYKTLIKSVKNNIAGTKKVGIFLSGGIDSCIILAIYKKLFPETKIKTFTAVFEDPVNKSIIGENKEVKKICDHFKCKNYLVKIREKNLLNFLKKNKAPSSGILECSFKMLSSKAKKEGVEVILNGEGSDEMFFGYDHNLSVIAHFNKKFSFLKKKYYLRNKFFYKKNKLTKIQDVFLIGGANIDINQKKIFNNKMKGVENLKATITKKIKSFNLKNPEDADKILSKIDYDIKIPELQIRRAEFVAMNEGVEMRFPFLNLKLQKIMDMIPLNLKINKNLEEKYILRAISKKLIPQNLLSEKQPFGLPAVRKKYFANSLVEYKRPAFNYFFYNNINKIENILINNKEKKINFIKLNELRKMINVQKNINTCFFDNILFKILSINIWFKEIKKLQHKNN